MEMEMEMVFNGYSLTGFSITIYNIITFKGATWMRNADRTLRK